MRATVIKWHRRLAWVAGICAIGWALTGILHPIMVWTSPVAAARMPPLVPLELSDARPPAEMLVSKVPAQVSELRVVNLAGHSHYAVKLPGDPIRRYFDPATGTEKADGDRERAIELARHYLGDATSPVADARIVTGFDNDYTPVNRLLPVWRVALTNDAGLVAFVDTGSGRVAAINHGLKRNLQSLFRTIHTLSFIPAGAGPLRAIIMTGLVGTIIASTLFGIAMLVMIRRKKRATGARHWHRVMGYATAIPALAFAISGLWHLLLGQDGSTDGTPRVPVQSLAVADLTTDLAGLWAGFGPDTAPVALSYLATPEGSPLLRLIPPPSWNAAQPAAPTGHEGHQGHGGGDTGSNAGSDHSAHQARLALFRGVPTGGAGLLLDVGGTHSVAGNEAGAARALAASLTGQAIASDAPTTLVTRFNDDYGFVNKRLPVWRIDLADGRAVYVDLTDATIAAQTNPGLRRAGWVFDIFHKGGFMDAIGPVPRDIILMIAAFLIAVLSGVGLTMLRRR